MELLLDDEQRMLQDSVAGQFADLGGVKRTRKLRNTGEAFDRAVLERMGSEGWLGVLVPADAGGLGLAATELALMCQEAGRHLAPEPLAQVALAAWALSDANDHSGSSLRDKLIAGRAVVACTFDGARQGTRATVVASGSGASLRLSGSAAAVPFASGADAFIVETRVGLALAERGASGISLVDAATVDGRPLTRVSFRDVPARAIAGGITRADRLFDLTLMMASAELVGVMSAALDMTVDYLKTRTQFGKPIGSFQALQHRAVDDFTRIVSSRSFLFQVLAQGERVTSAMAAAVKAHISAEALALAKSSIQMHGAIGFTDEHDIGLYLKRAMWLSAAYGNAAVQRQRFGALSQR